MRSSLAVIAAAALLMGACASAQPVTQSEPLEQPDQPVLEELEQPDQPVQDELDEPDQPVLEELDEPEPEPTPSGEPMWLDGRYELVGYGFVVEVADGVPELTLETRSTCLRLGRGLIDSLQIVGTVEDTGTLRLRDTEGSVTEYLARPNIPGDGSACSKSDGTQTPDSAVSARALMEVLEQRYPFFDLRQVDFEDVQERYEPLLAATDTPEAFADVAAALFAELDDGHTGFGDAPTGRTKELLDGFSDRGFGEDEAIAAAASYVNGVTLLSGSETWDIATQVRSGRVDESTGYLRLDALFTDPVATLASVDTALESFAGDDHLIIDLRFNGGGSDLLANAIAGRFVEESYHAYTKYTGSEPEATRQLVEVDPQVRDPFLGSVTILTSPLTASAAENLIIALQSGPRPVVVVGETTSGELSDAIPWFLPNGLEITIGMEVYETPDGVSFEETGILPDVIAPFEPWEVGESAANAIIDTATATP